MDDRSENDRLFDSLMSEYQRIDVPSPDLARAVRQGHKKIVRGVIVMVIISTFLCTVGLTKVIVSPTPSNFAFAFMEIGFPIVAMAFVLWSQRKSWCADAASTRSFLLLELERRRDEIRRMTFTRFACPVLALLSLLFQVLMVREHPGGAWLSVAGIVGLGTPYLIALGIFVHAGRKRAQFSRAEDRLVKRLIDLDDEGPHAV